MAKDTYFFPHDYEPTSDPKIQALLSEFGAVGYGIYWRICEMMHSHEKHILPRKKYIVIAIAKQMLQDAAIVEDFIKKSISEYELFESDGDFFWSNRILRNIHKRGEIKEKRKIAGRNGGLARVANAKQIEANAKQNQPKERKGKERKEVYKGAEFIAPTLQDVELFFLENGYINAKKAFNYYNTANWKDSRGQPVKNWKQKMIANWFKDENKIKSEKLTSAPVSNANEVMEKINAKRNGRI